jgi:hypothetical protein
VRPRRFLFTAAMLTVASASAYAASAQLPDTMLGGWCPTTDKPNIYIHSKLQGKVCRRAKIV